jgi:trehalose-phosphatase
MPPLTPITPELDRALDVLARTPVLLVATDFDGTLAPIAPRPEDACALPPALSALAALAQLPHTHGAVLSGRPLADLRALVPVPGVTLVGSHGVERDDAPTPPIDPAAAAELARAANRLDALVHTAPGARLEHKPRGVALHARALPADAAQSLLDAALALAPEFPALTPRPGLMVLELTADAVTKGDALSALRHLRGSTSTVFLGDDHTDEHALAVLGPADLGIKVGAEGSAAHHRLPDPEAVAALLTDLAQRRAAVLASRPVPDLRRLGLLSDLRTAALIDDRACLRWLCLPRLDSAALFASLLDGPAAGEFSITPIDNPAPARQSYLPDSMVLVTEWGALGTPGHLRVTDYLDSAGGRAFQRAGRTDLIRVIEGNAPARIRFAPRADFGRTATTLELHDGAVDVDGWGDPIVLLAPGVTWRLAAEGKHHTAEADVDPAAAQGPIVLELRYASASRRPHVREEPDRRTQTARFWSAWAASLRVPPVHADLVRRSALVLRALSHGPSGAIAAAATTSLPEHLGGVRNWDYRFCWPRDAAMAAAALLRLGNSGTAMRLLDWILSVVDKAESPDRLRPIYTLTGADLGPEGEISELTGFAGSRPVRVGNAAAQQVQLDVFGPIVDLVAMLAQSGAPIGPDHWRLTRAMVAAVEARWREPDHGIWEIRGPKRHHVHSKAMCFLTVDRALAVHEAVTGETNLAWLDLREAIRRDVLEHGASPRNQGPPVFTTAYNAPDLDAAALAVGLSGLLDHADPRWAATVDAVYGRLLRGAVVDRYRFDDGLPGREGGFLLCTGWLIESLLTLNRRDQAHDLLERFAALAGPTGGFAEQHEPDYDLALGNYPQAYSHLAFINAAVALHRAGSGADQ